jgi:predicted flap endonuclease-1-like 5' DNA nuclease
MEVSMGAFVLGMMVAWAIEWVFFTYYWKPNNNEDSSTTDDGVLEDCEKQLKGLLTKLQDKDRDISHLRARIAMLQESTDHSASQQVSEDKAATPSQSATPKIASPETSPKASPKTSASKPKPNPVTRPAPQKRSSAKDDLKKVSGIGPKIAELMAAAGIDSFDKLARSDIATLKAVLDKAGTRYATADPQSWPKQAELIKAGNTDGLQKIVATLKK